MTTERAFDPSSTLNMAPIKLITLLNRHSFKMINAEILNINPCTNAGLFMLTV